MFVAISTICQIGIEGIRPLPLPPFTLITRYSCPRFLSLFNQSITFQTSSMIFRIISPSYHACGKNML